MIPILIALAAAAQGTPAMTPDQCTTLVKSDAARAVEAASEWHGKGGGLAARQCLGLAYAQLERWPEAAAAFEQAALEADAAKDRRRADFLVQSANAWLAADDAAKARKAIDAALASTLLSPELRGEAYFDRARADVALGDMASARSDIDQGLKLVPSDPFGWYLSAALAQREGRLQRARADIAKAVEGAPDDADVLLLAGNLAGMAGENDAAKAFHARAAQASPDSVAGRAASAALAANQGEAAPAPKQ